MEQDGIGEGQVEGSGGNNRIGPYQIGHDRIEKRRVYNGEEWRRMEESVKKSGGEWRRVVECGGEWRRL